MVIAIVNNDYNTCRRLLNSGLDLHERIGSWARQYLATVWHSPRCGAEIVIDEYKINNKIDQFGQSDNSNSNNNTNGDNDDNDNGFDPPPIKIRPLGCIPFFNVCHSVQAMRPSYLHLACLFCSVEVVEVLMLMNVS